MTASKADVASALTVTRITHDGQPVATALDVTLRSLGGSILRQGVSQNESLPNDVRVEVPAHESVIITSPGGSKATLEPGAIDTFHHTGSGESVAISQGKTSFDDPLDFYHVSGSGVNALAHGTIYSVDVSATSVTVTCTSGSIEARRVGSASAGTSAQQYVVQVNTISTNSQTSVTYALGPESAADLDAELQAAETAAARGDVTAEVNLGIMYGSGRGVARNPARALYYLRLAAAQGSADGEVDLGVMHEAANGVSRDEAQALHYYQLAAAQNNPTGQVDLGRMYLFAYGTAQDYPSAVHYFRLAIAQGNPAGEWNLGYMYARGLGVPQSYALALQHYELAAAFGDPWGLLSVGYMYARGYGVPQDYATARDYFQHAAAQDDGSVDLELGYAYEFGLAGVPKDYALAKHYYQLAVGAGDTVDRSATIAEDCIGRMYENAQPFPNYGAALYYYRIGAMQGDSLAETDLGRMYYLGRGVPQDYPSAMRWYQLAAAAGDGYAEKEIGDMYYYGRGVPQDYGYALRYYHLSAAQIGPLSQPIGAMESADSLGHMYENGLGASRDYATALYYYKLAAALGDVDAQAGVQRLQALLNQSSPH